MPLRQCGVPMKVHRTENRSQDRVGAPGNAIRPRMRDHIGVRLCLKRQQFNVPSVTGKTSVLRPRPKDINIKSLHGKTVKKEEKNHELRKNINLTFYTHFSSIYI